MADDPQIKLRVSRFENDTVAVYELIGDIRTTQQGHSRRFDAVDRRFDAVEAAPAEVVRRLPEPS